MAEDQIPEQQHLFDPGPALPSQKKEQSKQGKNLQREQQEPDHGVATPLETDARAIDHGVTIPLEANALTESQQVSKRARPPILPSRWEDAREAAIKRNALQVLLKQMSIVEPPLEYLRYLVSIATDEGLVWVVFGESGSGKSSFFHTLEYQTKGQIRTHIISADSPEVDLSNHLAFTSYLKEVITKHQFTNDESIPLVIVLEQRETDMRVEERNAVAQALRNALRSPGPGKNTVFVLPVTNSNHGDLFLDQVKSTGVFVPQGHNTIYTFYGPPYTQHVDILSSLCVALNDKDITEYGLERSDLQKLVSPQQTIGQYIRLIKQETVGRNKQFQKIITNNSYRPFTVIVCFVNPLPGYRTEPIIKAMTLDAFGKIRTAELLRATSSRKGQMWKGKPQALQNIMEALDLRIVEVAPEIIAKMLYAYGWQPTDEYSLTGGILGEVERRLAKQNIIYNEPKSVRQNLSQQLRASNLFHIIAGEETGRGYHAPRYSRKDKESDLELKASARERSEISLTKIACEISHDYQHNLHRMFSLALKDLLSHSTKMASVADFKDVYPEPALTLTDAQGIPQKFLRPDVVIEMHDKLFLLELCWRSDEHFTYADIASYILRKLYDSYLHLPLVKALEAGS